VHGYLVVAKVSRIQRVCDNERLNLEKMN